MKTEKHEIGLDPEVVTMEPRIKGKMHTKPEVSQCPGVKSRELESREREEMGSQEEMRSQAEN